MDARLAQLIAAYQSAVARSVGLMVSQLGIRRPASSSEWADMAFPRVGELPDGSRFYKHGYGCAVRTPEFGVDFDFGSEGQITGFCPYRLAHFAAKNTGHSNLNSQNEIERLVELSVESGEIVKSEYILYYLANEYSP